MLRPAILSFLASASCCGSLRADSLGLRIDPWVLSTVNALEPPPPPPMGWNTWNHFGCNVSESTLQATMDAFVDLRLKEFGYDYIIVDDCWQADARENGTNRPVPDPERFPNGIKPLSDRAHSLGLKFGIYSSAGVKTCGGRFGSLGYEHVDAETYAEWGVDYLKYDNCYNEGLHGTKEVSKKRYGAMSQALKSTGRTIKYAMCNWGEDASWEWAGEIADTWRVYGDIIDWYDGYDSRCSCEPEDRYNCTWFGHHCSLTRIIEWAAPISEYGGRDGWNDLDMLEIGNGNMTHDEYVTHFSLWALLKSPLILGNDLKKMTAEDFSIITNRELIRINQDPLGVPARRLWKKSVQGGGDLQLWLGPLDKGEHVLALFNNSPSAMNTTIVLADFIDAMGGTWMHVDIWDLWSNDSQEPWKGLGGLNGGQMSVFLRSHQTRVWRVRSSGSKSPDGTTDLLIQL